MAGEDLRVGSTWLWAVAATQACTDVHADLGALGCWPEQSRDSSVMDSNALEKWPSLGLAEGRTTFATAEHTRTGATVRNHPCPVTPGVTPVIQETQLSWAHNCPPYSAGRAHSCQEGSPIIQVQQGFCLMPYPGQKRDVESGQGAPSGKMGRHRVSATFCIRTPGSQLLPNLGVSLQAVKFGGPESRY